MKIYYPLTIDLYKLWPLPVMTAQQGNAGRGAAITLVASGQVVQLEGGTVTFYVRKPDGTVSFLPAKISGTSILCDFTTQMLAVPGVLQVEVLISGGTEEAPESISTPIFQVVVQPSNIDSSAIESQNEFTALQEALAQVSGAVSGADAAAEAATEAAEAAGDAATAANQATQAANTAAEDANDAAEAAGGATTAANQAAQAANTAAGSANSAASAANQAAQAAQTAISDLKPVATSGKASDVSVETISGMTAANVQDALSQLNSKVAGKADSSQVSSLSAQVSGLSGQISTANNNARLLATGISPNEWNLLGQASNSAYYRQIWKTFDNPNFTGTPDDSQEWCILNFKQSLDAAGGRGIVIAFGYNYGSNTVKYRPYNGTQWVTDWIDIK